MSDAYTWRSGTSFTSVATPLPPIDILRDEDDDLVNYEDHLEWAEGMDLERLGSFEGEVFGQGDTAELEAGT